MAADIDIINSALSKLGEQPILALTDPSEPARLANRTYDNIRDAMLREFPWNFATRRAALAASTTVPVWEYVRSFPLPADCLRLILVQNESDSEWRLEGMSIVTSLAAPLNIKYIARVEVDMMDSAFRDVLAARLAMEWAEPLAQTSTVVASMSRMYTNKLQVARAADGQEDRQKLIESSSFIDARF